MEWCTRVIITCAPEEYKKKSWQTYEISFRFFFWVCSKIRFFFLCLNCESLHLLICNAVEFVWNHVVYWTLFRKKIHCLHLNRLQSPKILFTPDLLQRKLPTERLHVYIYSQSHTLYAICLTIMFAWKLHKVFPEIRMWCAEILISRQKDASQFYYFNDVNILLYIYTQTHHTRILISLKLFYEQWVLCGYSLVHRLWCCAKAHSYL